MNRSYRILLITCLFMIVPNSRLWSEAERDHSYAIGGSGTNVSLARVLAKAFMDQHPNIHLKVLPSIGSTGGIKAVHKGRIKLGLVSRALREIERTWNLSVLPYAKTVLIFGVHPSVSEDHISSEQVLAIYEGKFTHWKDQTPIIPLIREEGDSGAEILIQRYPDFKRILENAYRSGIWRIEYRDAECNRSIERLKGSVCWTDLGSIQIEGHRIKPLKLNGVEPTNENLLSGKYVLCKELSFVYQEPLPEELREFISFVKSPEGSEMIRKNGYVPVPKK